MKKILSVILTASMLITSAALPAFAENENVFELSAVGDAYSAFVTNANDVEKYNLTYDDGTATNTLDNSNALKVTDATKLFNTGGEGSFLNDFFLSVDVCFDGAADANTASGVLVFRGNQADDSNYNIGPKLTLNGGNLRNETGSEKYKTLVSGLKANTWYRLEFAGKFKDSKQGVDMKVYAINEGSLKVLGEVSSIGLRNFAAGNSGKNPYILQAENMSVDNVKFIYTYPDTLNITSESDEIEVGGDALPLGYEFLRGTKTVTTDYPVTWSVYEKNGSEIAAGSDVTISDKGVLTASDSATPRIVTVKATATLHDTTTVIGEKDITVSGVDISQESFHDITLNGDSTIKIGGAAKTYTFTATKNGAAADIASSDIDWRIYDSTGMFRNNNKNITIENGVLTVSKDAIAQDIKIAAYSKPGGYRHGTFDVKLEYDPDIQTETVLASDACEETIGTAERVAAPDGSGGYLVTAPTRFCQFPETKDYVYVEFDMKFGDVGENFYFYPNSKNDNTMTVRRSGNTLQAYSGGKDSNTDKIADIDPDKWYHLEILYARGIDNGKWSVNMYEYDASGNKGEKITATGLRSRNDANFGSIMINAGVSVDNIKITDPIPETTLSAARATMYAGETNKLTATFTKNGLPIKKDIELTYFVTDEDGEQINSNLASVSGGELKVSAMAQDQNVKVAAYIGTEKVAETTVEIKSAEIFTVEKIGIKYDDDNVIEKLYVNKKLFYQDEVVFTMAFYDDNNNLIAVRTFKSYGKNLATGTVNPVTVNWDIPEGFNTTDGKASVFIWTSF